MGKRVMVVDDSVFVVEEMRYLLKDTGFDICGFCKSGEEALSLYENVQPDVVTMDIVLPGMDGIEAMRQIRAKHPEALVVVVSSLAYDDTIEDAKEAGATDFIFKPFDKEDMLKALSRAVGLG